MEGAVWAEWWRREGERQLRALAMGTPSVSQVSRKRPMSTTRGFHRSFRNSERRSALRSWPAFLAATWTDTAFNGPRTPIS